MVNFLNARRMALLFLGLLLLTQIFQRNLLDFAERGFFSEFQRDSEALVVGGIVADDRQLEKRDMNLGYVSKSGPVKIPENIFDAYEIFEGRVEPADPDFNPYWSQYGLQEVVYSRLHSILGIQRLALLQLLPSALLAAVLIALHLLYRKIYDTRFAWVFLLTLAGSPWLVSFARNLYWSPFLWFLPTLFAALLYRSRSARSRYLFFAAIFASVFVKSLCGYEYLSAITLLAVSVFIIAPYFDKDALQPRPDWKSAIWVFGLCVGGFVLALLIHAGMRGDSVWAGLKTIYMDDVRRRTHADPSVFDPMFRSSLEATILGTIKTYVVNWSTPLTLWIPGAYFRGLLLLALLGLAVKYRVKHKTFVRDASLLGFMLLVPLSWHVLAKAHSAQHTHMNYVLWYLGFVPALVYVAMNSAVVIWVRLRRWLSDANEQDF